MTLADQTKLRIQTGQINTFFDILTDILLKISGGTLNQNKEFNKYFSSYLLCRYISMRLDLLKYAEILNQLQTLITPSQLYKIAYKIIPKQKSSFIPYIKKAKQKNKVQKNNEDLINIGNLVKMSIFDL